jgi:predicted RecA/RadA family phage recombinase
MATATYKRGEIRTAVYTNGSGSDIAVDEIVIGGVVHNKKSHICVARENIANGATGIVAVSGVFRFPKVSAAVIKMGESVNWDASEGEVDDNAHSNVAGDVVEFGTAMHNAGNGATTIDIDISLPGTYDGSDG